jgi:hypothetical protein
MALPADHLVNLRAALSATRERFLHPYLVGAVTLDPPGAAQRLDQSAFVVLSHAALEEYFEQLAMWVHAELQMRWSATKTPLPTLATLSHLRGAIKFDPKTHSTLFDRIRLRLNEVAGSFPNMIKNNHGASTHYLREIYYPIGIDLPNDARMLGAIDTLADLRGSAAHTATTAATLVRAPVDLDKIVNDCLDLAEAVMAAVHAIEW